MQAGLVLIGAFALLQVVGDGARLLSPSETPAGLQSLSGGLSILEALAFALLLTGAGLIAVRERLVPFAIAAVGALVWCLGWLAWNLSGSALPIHPDLLMFATIAAVCLGLRRNLAGLQHLPLVAAALLALVPFLTAVAHASPTKAER